MPGYGKMNIDNRPLIVLDLDNTLIFCSDSYFPESQMSTPHGYLSIRDGAIELIERAHKYFDLMVWSNSGPAYVDDILAMFWPTKIPLIDVFYSTNSRIKGFNGMGIPFFKDMKKISKKHPEYPMGRILGVDDLPQTYSQNYGNLITVKAFEGVQDRELFQLADYVEKISTKENFRKVEKRYWKQGVTEKKPAKFDEFSP